MLIKIIILILSISFTLAYDKDSVNKIFDNLIKQKFNQIDVNELNNPFTQIDSNISKDLPYSNLNVVNKIEKQEKILPNLQAIFNNHVKLENKWYKVGDEVFGFKIVKIQFDSVVLKDEEEEKVLSLIKEKEIIRISNENY